MFSSLLKRIRGGEAFDGAELLPFLTQESKRERYRVNLGLAAAFYARHEPSCSRATRPRLCRRCSARTRPPDLSARRAGADAC
ncbi:MAG: hypothetical protein LC795_13755 [Acidobacteria bacterium]|nr:hypothetical protein [Acidobacteriota bacterium]MCA1620344.1 hypothetical protein [Acidobacteriota bacterium]